MSNLFEIDREMLDMIDPETGEILDYEVFTALAMERDTKIDNTAMYIKSLLAEAAAIKAEEEALAARRKAKERKAERLKGYLSAFLNGMKFESAKTKISFRNSVKVEVGKEFVDWAKEAMPELLTFKPEVSKTAIKEALAEGKEVQYAAIVESRSIQIG